MAEYVASQELLNAQSNIVSNLLKRIQEDCRLKIAEDYYYDEFIA